MATKDDPITAKQLERTKHFPQFVKEQTASGVVKFRWCRLCGKKLSAGEEFRAHMAKHQ